MLVQAFNYRVAFALVFVAMSGVLIALSQSPHVNRGLSTILVLTPLAVLLAAAVRSVSKKIPREFENHELRERIANFVDMISRARESVVIVTGRLNRNLYTQPAVVEALRRLSWGVKVKVIYTADELDLSSAEFIQLLKQKGAKLYKATGMRLRHAVIVDARDTKLEEPVSDDAEHKCAKYFYNRPTVARSVLKELEALRLRRAPFPSIPSR